MPMVGLDRLDLVDKPHASCKVMRVHRTSIEADQYTVMLILLDSVQTGTGQPFDNDMHRSTNLIQGEIYQPRPQNASFQRQPPTIASPHL